VETRGKKRQDEYLLEEQGVSEISLMEEFPNINVSLTADGPEDISFPYFCQCMHFGATVCVTCQTLGVLNFVHLSQLTVGANERRPLKQSSLIMNCQGALDLTINRADLNVNEWFISKYSDLSDFMFVLLVLLS